MPASPKPALRRALFGGFDLATRTATRIRYSLTAPQSIDEVDRGDLRQLFLWVRARHGARGRGRIQNLYEAWRPQYVWGILSAAMTASSLGLESMSVIEFGVAGGNGLVAMETAAEEAEALLGVTISLYGFDTGAGMPQPVDHRDAPFSVRPGYFAMDVEKLKARLRRAELVLGPVGETLPEFLEQAHPPLGFAVFDLDYYSSAMQAFRILEAGDDKLLPRVFCFLPGTMWPPWTAFNGQRAAVSDFNADNEGRKLSRLHGLKYSLPSSEHKRAWPDLIYLAEIFDHELYTADQGGTPRDQRLVE
jgi:hypothetical protein